MRITLGFCLALLLAFPAAADEADSCKATAEELDEAYQQADEAYQQGDLSTAGKIRKQEQEYVDTFMDICLKPRVCPSYYHEMQYFLPPEYSDDQDVGFTAFREMWEAAGKPKLCSEEECAVIAEDVKEKGGNAELRYMDRCIKNCSQPISASLENASILTQWQQHDRIYCRDPNQ